MANELKHKDVGTGLSKAEWEGVDSHEIDGQTTGDLIVASSATQLSRLAASTAETILTANGAGAEPTYKTTVKGLTRLQIPVGTDLYD